MWKIVEKILHKPEQERRRILFVSVTLLTTLIIFVWLSFLYARYLNSANERRGIQHTASPFEIFAKEAQGRFNQVKADYIDLTGTFSEINNTLKNMATSSSFAGASSESSEKSSFYSTTSEGTSSQVRE